MSQAEAEKQGAIAAVRREVRRPGPRGHHRRLAPRSCAAARTSRSTAQLGLVKLLGESSIGSGVRRVEALVGVDAYRFLAREHVLVAQLTEAVKGRPEELPERVTDIARASCKDAEKEIEKVRAEKVLARPPAGSAEGAEDVGGVALVAGPVPDGAGGGRPAHAGRSTSAAGIPGGRPAVVACSRRRPTARLTVMAAVNEAARERGVKAGELVRAAAKTLVGGKGGGKDDVAQGGGPDAGRAIEAEAARRRVERPRSPSVRR